MDVVLTGEVTAVRPDGFSYTRVGTWREVTGRWVQGTGDGMDRTPLIAADAARPVSDPPPRREDI